MTHSFADGGLDPEPDDSDRPTEPPKPRTGAAPAADVVVFAALRDAKRPTSPEALAATTGLPVRNVQRALGKLVSERHVRRAGGGLFAVAARRPPSRRGRGGAGATPAVAPDDPAS